MMVEVRAVVVVADVEEHAARSRVYEAVLDALSSEFGDVQVRSILTVVTEDVRHV